MTGEPCSNDIRLLQQNIDAEVKITAERFHARDLALEVALRTMENRLNSMNEFRETLSDQATKFITRPEHDGLVERLSTLALDSKGYPTVYVTRPEIRIIISRIELMEQGAAALQSRYATMALLFSAAVIIANLALAFWGHIVAAPLLH